jgi:Zn-finger nucleic acid-binding protein
MDIVMLAGLELDRCGLCYGLWFDRSELKMLGVALSDEHLADQLRDLLSSLGSTATSTPAAYPKCPVCMQLMQRKIYAAASGVMVNRCDAHGTWVQREAAIRLIGLMRGDGDAELHALEARRSVEQAERQLRQLKTAQIERASESKLMAPAERPSRISFVFDLFDFF